MSVNAKDLATWALLGGAVYLLLKVTGGANQAIKTAADWYVKFTSPASPVPQGAVLMPDGSTIPVASLNILPDPTGTGAYFDYNLRRWYLNTPSDANGNWLASTS